MDLISFQGKDSNSTDG